MLQQGIQLLERFAQDGRVHLSSFDEFLARRFPESLGTDWASSPEGKLKPANAERRGRFYLVWTDRRKKKEKPVHRKTFEAAVRAARAKERHLEDTLTDSSVLILSSQMCASRLRIPSNATCDARHCSARVPALVRCVAIINVTKLCTNGPYLALI
jgi:hypothetical protein